MIAVCADVHVGNFAYQGNDWKAGLNERGRLAVEVLARAVRQAKQEGATAFYVAGDLFHVRRPDPALLGAVARVLHEDAADLPVVIVPGNHDMLDATADDGNTTCAPLQFEATVVKTPTWLDHGDTQVLAVPFRGGEPMRDHLRRVCGEAATWDSGKARRVLVTHIGVYQHATAAPWARDAKDGVEAEAALDLLDLGRFDAAFVGNYHQHLALARNGRHLWQIGTLCPGSFSDAGDYPLVGGLAFDMGLGGPALAQIPGPRFLLTRPGDPDGERGRDNTYHVRMRGEGPVEAPAWAASYEIVAEPPVLASIEKLPVVEDADAAISEFTARMRLPTGVPLDEVLTLARSYWRKAAR
jgi:hypothetical protein